MRGRQRSPGGGTLEMTLRCDSVLNPTCLKPGWGAFCLSQSPLFHSQTTAKRNPNTRIFGVLSVPLAQVCPLPDPAGLSKRRGLQGTKICAHGTGSRLGLGPGQSLPSPGLRISPSRPACAFADRLGVWGSTCLSPAPGEGRGSPHFSPQEPAPQRSSAPPPPHPSPHPWKSLVRIQSPL